MESSGLTRWLVVLAVVPIVSGAGRLPKAMGEFARGVRAFRSGMREAAPAQTAGEQPVEAQPADRAGGLALR
jgi:sec-independent protein translocase protein TatA